MGSSSHSSPLAGVITLGYIALHLSVYIFTFVYLSFTSPKRRSSTSNCVISFLAEFINAFRERQSLAFVLFVHIINVGFDFGILFGWYFDSRDNAFRGRVSHDGVLLIIGFSFLLIVRITCAIYIYGVKRHIFAAILQIFDFEFYSAIMFERNIENINLMIEQLYRNYAITESFPMALIQTYLLVNYYHINTEKAGGFSDDDYTYQLLTLISLIFSILYILALQITHDAKFIVANTNVLHGNVCCSLRWLTRVSFRTCELLARILLFSYVWLLFGGFPIIVILLLEWFFGIYNHYVKKRYDDSSERSIRQWRKENKFFLWPLIFDDLVSFWNISWSLPMRNAPKQTNFRDVMDLLQGWTFATVIYGQRRIRLLTKQFPLCDCKREMDEYWTKASAIKDGQLAMGVDTRVRTKIINNNSRNLEHPECNACANIILFQHYFRCPSFLKSQTDLHLKKYDAFNSRSGHGNGHNHNRVAQNKSVALSRNMSSMTGGASSANTYNSKHGRYLCIDCGYARMTYLPFLFIFSRNIFTWYYVVIVSILSAAQIRCHSAGDGDGDDGGGGFILCPVLSHALFTHALEVPVLVIGILCHVVYPWLFLLMLYQQQIQIGSIQARDFAGKVVKYAKNAQWELMLDLIRSEEQCDVNEIGREGRTALLYAAMGHNFNVVRELVQLGADTRHVDINGCALGNLLDTIHENLTAASRASKNGDIENLNLCIEFGADLDKTDKTTHTPLMIAVKEREIPCVRLLLTQTHNGRINIDKQDTLGRTAVIVATQYGYEDMLQLILEDSKPDVDIADLEGKTAMNYAIEYSKKACAKLIHEYKKRSAQAQLVLDDENRRLAVEKAAALEKAQHMEDRLQRQRQRQTSNKSAASASPSFGAVSNSSKHPRGYYSSSERSLHSSSEDTHNTNILDKHRNTATATAAVAGAASASTAALLLVGAEDTKHDDNNDRNDGRSQAITMAEESESQMASYVTNMDNARDRITVISNNTSNVSVSVDDANTANNDSENAEIQIVVDD